MDISHFEGLVITRELDSENPLITTKAIDTPMSQMNTRNKFIDSGQDMSLARVRIL